MPNEKSAVDEFLGGLDEVQDDPFKPQEFNVFEDKSVADTAEVKEDEEEKSIPFHKDPKLQKFIDKEISKRMASVKAEPVVASSDKKENLVSAFTQIIGNDTPEKVHALNLLKETVTDLEQKATAGERRVVEAQQAEAAAKAELESGFESIEDEFSVDISSNSAPARKMRSDFIDFVKLVAPKDAQGEVTNYPDFKETFKVFQKMSKTQAQPSRAKELASRSMSRSSDVSTTKQSGPRSFEEFERWINKN